ncbi:universal stress protein [Mycobacterium cookii]|uniref:Universal stress protein n=1 Tax=Mycobacterium cookii TaxID=1775 RepID=A0A7I7KWE6_9MYCO|nr:universal stress protein [Mycobacterium cookii]MCV7329972.1 universal stress protein [Mycobacterium cookii]BBX45901.1 universal stress protein [Mycobacterium cookii]
MRESNAARPAVVVGIDGSQAAIHAAQWAVDEAVSREIPLRLLEIIPGNVEPAPGNAVGNVQMEVEYGETALRTASAAVEATGKPVKVETEMVQGDPAKILIDESRSAAMICIGSVGIGRFARALLGSTATEVAEAAHCPVAIIRSRQSRPKPGSPLIVAAVSDTPDGERVIDTAIHEAQLRHAPVLAVGVLRADTADMPSGELDRRVELWGKRHPGVQIYAAATRTAITDFLAVMDRTIQLAVIGSSDADQVAKLIGPHRHPVIGHAECSVLIARS